MPSRHERCAWRPAIRFDRSFSSILISSDKRASTESRAEGAPSADAASPPGLRVAVATFVATATFAAC